MGNVLRGLFAPAKSKEKDAVEVFDGGMDEMDSDDEMPDIGRLNDESESPRDGKPSTAVIVQNTRKRSSWSFSRSKKPAPIRPSGADDGAGTRSGRTSASADSLSFGEQPGCVQEDSNEQIDVMCIEEDASPKSPDSDTALPHTSSSGLDPANLELDDNSPACDTDNNSDIRLMEFLGAVPERPDARDVDGIGVRSQNDHGGGPGTPDEAAYTVETDLSFNGGTHADSRPSTGGVGFPRQTEPNDRQHEMGAGDASMSMMTSFTDSGFRAETVSNVGSAGQLPPGVKRIAPSAVDIDFRKRLGSGRYGTVYLASWDGSSDATCQGSHRKNDHSEGSTRPRQTVAVKVLKDNNKRFYQEVHVLCSVARHPNLLHMFGVVDNIGHAMDVGIVMEYVDGGSLHDLIHPSNGVSPTPLSLKRIVQILLDVARAMNFLHSSSPPILHRDLKPRNLILDKVGSCKVCDFGLSRFLGEGEVASTQDCGTCVYMAPEVFLNTKYTPSVDVYSYALVVWELITLQHPWADKLRGGTVFTVWDAVRREERPMVPTTMHPDLAQIICDCWKATPSDRPTFEEIVYRLEHIDKTNCDDNVSALDFPSNPTAAAATAGTTVAAAAAATAMSRRRNARSKRSVKSVTAEDGALSPILRSDTSGTNFSGRRPPLPSPTNAGPAGANPFFPSSRGFLPAKVFDPQNDRARSTRGQKLGSLTLRGRGGSGDTTDKSGI